MLESNTSVGDDPFTDSVTVTQVGHFPSSVQAVTVSFQQSLPADPATGTKTTTGTAPGLYGGTQDSTACDAAKMITYLGANPDKANAWASVQGIDPSTVGDYIGKLTPVILTTDTWVTNHGYRDGAATARPAVLQAGTAVLVDTYGTPRAKCSCGNPLTPPPDNTNLDHTKTQGTPWPDYQPANVTTITPAPQPATDLTLTNIQTGTTYQLPVGTATAGTFVAATHYDAQGENPGADTLYASDDGKTWNKASMPTNRSPRWCMVPTAGSRSPPTPFPTPRHRERPPTPTTCSAAQTARPGPTPAPSPPTRRSPPWPTVTAPGWVPAQPPRPPMLRPVPAFQSTSTRAPTSPPGRRLVRPTSSP